MQELFGKVDNLEMFIHPKFNESFKFMNDKQSITLAKDILDGFINSGYEQVVVIESGTSPLISIVKKLEKYKSSNLKLMQIKIPRDLNFNLYKWFETYLSEEELDSLIEINGQKNLRKEFLKRKCAHFDLESFIGIEKFTIYDSINDYKNYSQQNKVFHDILKGTDLYNIFTKPFLLFDEYINAGTIIRNFNGMVRLFTDNPEFKLSAYCMFLDNPKQYEKISFTLYDNSSELEAYRNGAYPFENRIDLIGYYYFISENDFQKVYLKELKEEILNQCKNILSNEINDGNFVDNENNYNNKLSSVNIQIKEFYRYLNKLINENSLLEILKENLEENQVKKYVTNNDIIRYLLKYLDEKMYGKNKIADFLDQVFELYAPSWSPMPVIFHLDYWNGFSKIQKEIDNVGNEIANKYKKYRLLIIKQILESLEMNNKIWKENISKLL